MELDIFPMDKNKKNVYMITALWTIKSVRTLRREEGRFQITVKYLNYILSAVRRHNYLNDYIFTYL